ncbi:hypothetical protein LRS05_14435 [Flavobacterium sp. J372]|uniref:hypothetical protein n=1 Tax=Flavobacterium sp. J372 TaxID=2898436 RepID=UPI00215170DC|nr:hypothetical protein [Flavobacterium sp. J372]MCR5863244.1 hypothetical protein [Flavobacterium sp. J372]
MKKIIALFVVMLAFGLNANAQQKKAPKAAAKETTKELTVAEAAQSDLDALTAIITNLDKTKKQDLYNLFEYKHRTMREGLSAERKAAVSQSIEAKLKASFEPADIQKLENNPAVMRKLIQ